MSEIVVVRMRLDSSSKLATSPSSSVAVAQYGASGLPVGSACVMCSAMWSVQASPTSGWRPSCAARCPYVRKGIAMEQPAVRAVERAITYMRDNLGEQLAIDGIAHAAMFSKFYFTRLFHRMTGMSPGRFLSAIRIQRAMELLLSASMTVTDVSYRVGYNSMGTFSSRFRESVACRQRHIASSAVFSAICPTRSAPVSPTVGRRLSAAGSSLPRRIGRRRVHRVVLGQAAARQADPVDAAAAARDVSAGQRPSRQLLLGRRRTVVAARRPARIRGGAEQLRRGARPDHRSSRHRHPAG